MMDVEIDYARMGERKMEHIKAEHARVVDLIAEGVVVCEWRKANNLGVIVLWDCRDHNHLRETLASLPLAPFFSKIDIQPLVDHPLFPNGRPPEKKA